MPAPCLIRFTDDDGQRQAHVHRRYHGHPEEVVTNLSALKSVVDLQEDQPSPGNVAAQFVFLDKMWYALKEVQLGELEEELLALLYAPISAGQVGSDSYLRQHELLDSSTSIEAVSFLYEVELGESEWKVKIGHNSESVEGPVGEMFQLVSWGFTGELSEALGRFQ